MTEQLILQQLNQMPENLRQEVVDFMGYLIMKYKLTNKEPKMATPKMANILPTERVFGRAKGRYIIADDFDAPLEDFKDYM
jgi:Protein of unknown function (DUF2281)